MKVILRHDVPTLGKKFDVKNVADGHALNFLIPRGLVEIANENTIKRVEVEKTQHLQSKKVQQNILLKNLEGLKDITLKFEAKASAKGHLFSGIHVAEISKKLKEEKHLDIPEEAILLEKPIKEVGDFPVTVKVLEETVTFTVSVASKA